MTTKNHLTRIANDPTISIDSLVQEIKFENEIKATEYKLKLLEFRKSVQEAGPEGLSFLKNAKNDQDVFKGALGSLSQIFSEIGKASRTEETKEETREETAEIKEPSLPDFGKKSTEMTLNDMFSQMLGFNDPQQKGKPFDNMVKTMSHNSDQKQKDSELFETLGIKGDLKMGDLFKNIAGNFEKLLQEMDQKEDKDSSEENAKSVEQVQKVASNAEQVLQDLDQEKNIN